jgi:hypothetical protein
MIRFLWKKGFLNDLFAFLLSSSVSCVSVDAFSQNSKRPTSQLRRHLKHRRRDFRRRKDA